MNPFVRTGLVITILHTLIAIGLYFAAKNNAGIAQGEFVWFFLLLPDLLSVEVGYKLLGNLLSDIDSNAATLIVVSIFGGLQWFLLGVFSHFILKKVFSRSSSNSVQDENAT
jgi:hypothetical protein